MRRKEAMNEDLLEFAQRIDIAVEQKDESALLLAISDCETRLETEKGETRVDLH